MKNDSLKRRFLRRSPDGLEDRELLELLLQFTSEEPEKLADRILEEYVNIANLMEADQGNLSLIEGMNEDTLVLLRLVPEMHRRYFLTRAQTENRLTDTSAYGQYLLPYFYGARDEMVYMLTLDAASKVINCRLIGHGSVNSANVPVRKLVQEAINANATGVVLAHNHPSGIALPSRADVEVTLRLQKAMELVDIVLLDHIGVADDDFVSLRDSGYLYR